MADPQVEIGRSAPAEEAGQTSTYATASQWQLIRRKFRRHRLAVVSVWVLVLLYGMALFAQFLSPHDPFEFNDKLVGAPPMRVRIVEDNKLQRPFVYGYKRTVDFATMRRYYEVDPETKFVIRFFAKGFSYELWNLFPTDRHLLAAEDGGYLHLLGTDRLGRDMVARILYGARASLSIGLVGVLISFVLGLVIGGISGLVGGVVDDVIQRLIEIIRSFPTIPLWMALAAIVPKEWPQLWVYFGITIIVSLIGWTSLARVVRGKFLSLRDDDYVVAARLSGGGNAWIIRKHLLPAFASHVIASLTLAIPAMILAETALSFLGLGLRQPFISWGVLLQEAQNVRSVALMPWVFTPVLFIIVTVLAFNFVGDGMRDAADPYA
ncbi:MAG: ABC transporter permease [Gemmatimonadota bacterium]|nr:MAG: ABC transporter permease [Gemmatimonadota bacterium]UCH26509.1 MAG: ABC transporter permease [Trueperaceae bacterium]